MHYWIACATTIDDEPEFICAVLGAVGDQLETRNFCHSLVTCQNRHEHHQNCDSNPPENSWKYYIVLRHVSITEYSSKPFGILSVPLPTNFYL